MTDPIEPPPPPPDEGRLVGGRYRLAEVIGVGGMATVHRAIDTKADRSVAIKLLRREVIADTDIAMRFRREALAETVLRHPNIVACLETGTDDGQPFLVMELIEGEDLAARLRRVGRLSPSEAARIGLDVARALGVAHIRGIVHRDVKPGNILLARDGRAMVTDFGIARLAADTEGAIPGTTLGSVHYFSPEQAKGETTTGASDVYSLGPRAVRGTDRAAGVARRDDGGPGGGPDRCRCPVAARRPPGDPGRPGRGRRPGARPGSGAPLRQRGRHGRRARTDRLAPRPGEPDGRRPDRHVGRGRRRGRGGREPRRPRPLPPRLCDHPRPPVLSARPASSPVRRASPVIAGPLLVLVRRRGGRRRWPLRRIPAGPRGLGGGRARHEDAETDAHADADARRPTAVPTVKPTKAPTPVPKATPKPAAGAARDLCDPIFGFACGLEKGTYTPSRFEPPILFKLRDGWSTSVWESDLIGLDRQEGGLTFASGLISVYPNGDATDAPRSARLVAESFIDTDGVAARRPKASQVDKHKATIVDLAPTGPDRVPLFGTSTQTFYLEPFGTTRLIVIDGDDGVVVIAIEPTG